MPTITPPDPPLADDLVALRPWEPRDVEQIYRACQDPAIQQFIPLPRPYARADAEAYVERTKRQWDDGSVAAFAIVATPDDSRVLGAINLASFGAVGNSGYWVAPYARNGGVATRALRLLADWALGALGFGLVMLEIRPENESSLRVARAAGFHDAGHLDVNTVTGDKGGRILVRKVTDTTAGR